MAGRALHEEGRKPHTSEGAYVETGGAKMVRLIGLMLLLVCFWGCSSSSDNDCEPQVDSRLDHAFNELFTRLGDGWTGGGNVFSVLLPDGRTAWFSGTTYLGMVNADRSRPDDTPVIDNSLLIQDGSTLTTLHGGTADAPQAFLVPSEPTERYAPKASRVEGDRLYVFLDVFVALFQVERNDVAVFSLPDLSLIEIATVNDRPVVSYGTALLEQDGFVYIYGFENGDEGGGFMHVARAVAGDLLGPWEFFDGMGWTADPAMSARIFSGVAAQYSVIEDSGTIFLVQQEVFGFSERTLMFRGDSPVGPWQARTTVFCAPERSGDIITTNALAHPQFTADGNLLVSYLVSSFGTTTPVFANADNFRPVFVRVPLAQVLGR